MLLSDKISLAIRDVKDYPKSGIVFKDITPVLADPALVKLIVAEMASKLQDKRIDAIAAVEARGFIFGGMLAHALGCRFIPVRKAGKLPYNRVSREYDLEYGKSVVEMHSDSVMPGWRVLVHDDLLATGGTAGAAASLIQELGGEIAGFSFLVNLSFLPGEKNIIERFGVKPDYMVTY